MISASQFFFQSQENSSVLNPILEKAAKIIQVIFKFILLNYNDNLEFDESIIFFNHNLGALSL